MFSLCLPLAPALNFWPTLHFWPTKYITIFLTRMQRLKIFKTPTEFICNLSIMSGLYKILAEYKEVNDIIWQKVRGNNRGLTLFMYHAVGWHRFLFRCVFQMFQMFLNKPTLWIVLNQYLLVSKSETPQFCFVNSTSKMPQNTRTLRFKKYVNSVRF